MFLIFIKKFGSSSILLSRSLYRRRGETIDMIRESYRYSRRYQRTNRYYYHYYYIEAGLCGYVQLEKNLSIRTYTNETTIR